MINEEGKYEIDTSGDEFKAIDTNRTNDLAYVDKVYGTYDEKTGNFTGGFGQQIDTVTNQQIANVKDYANKQSAIQQEQTDHTINQINQQKEQSGKDYIQEGSAAYVDYQKATNAYGVNAEKMAESGMIGGGYSESSKVAMYTTYQNRVASARKVYSDAILNYNNAIKDAQIANSAALAEIAFNSQQAQLELAMNAINKKGELVDKIVTQKNAINSRYDAIWQNAIDNQYSYDTLNESSRQWQAEFDNATKNDAYDMVMSLINSGAGASISDELIAKAGLSRDVVGAAIAEYNRKATEESNLNKSSIQGNSLNMVMELINSGAGGAISDEMLANAGIDRNAVNSLVGAYNKAVAESTAKTNSALKSEAFSRVMSIINSGGGAGLTDGLLTEAGITRATANELINAYNNAAANENKKTDASLKSTALSNILTIVSAGGGNKITDDQLKEAGLSREALNDIIYAQTSLKDSSKSETEFSNRVQLATMVLNGYVPTDADYAAAGLTDATTKAQFKAFIEAVENSAIIDLGGDDGSPMLGSGSSLNSTTSSLLGR